jgi:Family of unknown function (DUF5856)
MKMSDFIGKIFQARDTAHSAHLNSHSYSEHMALCEFYNNIIDAADTITETYQGVMQVLIGNIVVPEVNIGLRTRIDILMYLTGQFIELQKDRYVVCDKENTVVQNKIDEAMAIYAKAIYKLKFLK